MPSASTDAAVCTSVFVYVGFPFDAQFYTSRGKATAVIILRELDPVYRLKTQVVYDTTTSEFYEYA